MSHIWSPWRIEYIRMEKPSGCILCDKPAEDKDVENGILFRGKTNFIMMNAFPYNPGHLLVAPYRHTARLDDLTRDEMLENGELIQKCIKMLQEAFNPMGFNIGTNMGAVAGAGIADHIHSHVVPRWQGDTNFLPVLSGVRSIPELVDDTYKTLKGCLE